MEVKKYIFSIIAIFSIPFYVFSAGNGTISATEEDQFSDIELTFSHDTTVGSLDRNILVILNQAGDSKIALGEYNSSYYILDSDSPLMLSEITSEISSGTYTIANLSLGSTCCTNQQIEDNTVSISAINTFTSGYYATDTFTITEPETPPASTSTPATTDTMFDYFARDFIAGIFIALMFYLIIWLISRIVRKM